MLQSQNSRYTRKYEGKSRGFAISIDALLAMVLTVAFLGFIGLGLQEEDRVISPSSFHMDQAANDAFAALDNSGAIADNAFRFGSGNEAMESAAEAIKGKAEALLPGNLGLKVKITKYVPADPIAACRSAADFDTCFPTGLRETGESSGTIPTDREVVHGRKLQMIRESYSKEADNICTVESVELKEKQPEKKITAHFDENAGRALGTEVMVSPTDHISCWDNGNVDPGFEEATVTMKIRDSSRGPVALMLAMDASGSMAEYDMVRQGPTTVSFGGGTCNYGICLGGNCPTSNAEYTNWVNLHTFKQGDVAGRFSDENAGYLIGEIYETYFYPGINESDTCGQIPKVKISVMDKVDGTCTQKTYYSAAPYDESSYPNANYTWLAAVKKEHLEDCPEDEAIIYGWSNLELSDATATDPRVPENRKLKIMFYPRYYGGPDTTIHGVPLTGNILGGGTRVGGTGSGTECVPDESSFKKLGEMYVPELKDGQAYGSFGGSYYPNGSYTGSSDCGLFIMLKKNGEKLDNYGSFVNPKKCTGSYCQNTIYCGSGCVQPGDVVEVWGWSDENIELKAPGTTGQTKFHFYKYDRTIVDQDTEITSLLASNPKTIDIDGNGCDGGACTMGDCDIKKGWNEFNDPPEPSNPLDTFDIAEDDHLLGLKIGINNIAGYEGNCKGPAFGIRRPDLTYRVTSDLDDVDCMDGICEKTMTSSPKLADGEWYLEGWSDEEVTADVNWTMQRIDAAKKATKTFINNINIVEGLGWLPDDRIGAISFNDAVIEPTYIVPPSDSTLIGDKELIKNEFLPSLTPTGKTATYAAIERATEALSTEAPDKMKIMILLTDGAANICKTASPCSLEQAAQDAKDAADAARAAGITIFTIGFADQPAIEDFEETLKYIAKHDEGLPTDLCAMMAPIGENCGKYYYAADDEALEVVYDKILAEVTSMFGNVDVNIPFPLGMLPVDAGAPGSYGVWDDSRNGWSIKESYQPNPKTSDIVWNPDTNVLTVLEESITYGGDEWFAIQFKAKLPCDSFYCLSDSVVFPPQNPENAGLLWGSDPMPIYPQIREKGTGYIFDWGGAGEEYCDPASPEPCRQGYMEVPFRYKDLKIAFENGAIEPGDKVSLKLSIENNGYYNADLSLLPAYVGFYRLLNPAQRYAPDCTGCEVSFDAGTRVNAAASKVDDSVSTVDAMSVYNATLCAALGAGCSPGNDQDEILYVSDIVLSTTGYIYAYLNEDISSTVKECRRNNSALIHCEAPKQARYFTIDYYVWVK